MIAAAHVLVLVHAVTGERLEPTDLRLPAEVPIGFACVRRPGSVVVTVDLERFTAPRGTPIDVSIRAGAPFDPAVLVGGGWIDVPGLPIDPTVEGPTRHELVIRPEVIRLEVQLIDARGRPIRGARPTLHGADVDPLGFTEIGADDPDSQGRYGTECEKGVGFPHPGELRVGRHRTPLAVSHRALLERRRLVVADSTV